MNRIVLVSIFLLVAITGVRGQEYWEEVKRPHGADGYVFSPTESGILYAKIYPNEFHYRSTNGGTSWEQLAISRVDTTSYSETIYIGYSGVFYNVVMYIVNLEMTLELHRSMDEGVSWILTNDSLVVSQIAEVQPGVLLGTDGLNRLYRSTDYGATWSMTPLAGYSPVNCAPLEHNTIILDGTSGRLAISTDNGETWLERTKAHEDCYLIYVSSGTLFSAPDYSGDMALYRSEDQGISWQPCPVSLIVDFDDYPYRWPILDLTNGRLLLASNRDLYFSDDDGVTWTLMPNAPEQPHKFVWGFPMPNGDLWGGRRGTLFRSSDAGATWTFASTGVRQAFTRQLAFISENSWLSATLHGLWRTDDAGQNWARILADTGATYSHFMHPIDVLVPDTFVFGMDGQVWLTQNSGQSFEPIGPPGGTINCNVFFGPDAVLFCSTNAGIMRSEDFGQTWTTIVSPHASLIQLVQHPGGRLFALIAQIGMAWPNDLVQSVDSGKTWSLAQSLILPYPQHLTLDIGPNGEIYILGYDNGEKLAVSTNEGVSWKYRSLPLNTEPFLGVNGLGTVFAYDHQERQALASADGGNSWYLLPKHEAITTPSSLFDLELSPAGYLYLVLHGGIYRTSSPTALGAFITGHVRRDADAECSTPDAQEPLRNWAVTLEGENTFYNTTGTDGRYTFFVDTGTYQIQVVPTQPLWWGLCDSIQTVHADSLFSRDTVDFAALALAECPLMSVSVGVPRLRRCFDNNAVVQYCNQGSETADSARVDVILDEFLEFVSADLPHEALGNNTFRFHLGQVAIGACDQFGLVVHVNCDSTVLGQTHCIAAHAYPDSLCTPVTDWSGATVVAEAECQDTVVALRLRNIGHAPTQLLPYIIIEDGVVLFHGQDEHLPGGVVTLERPANGHTWRIESQQEPGHPFSTVAVAFLEGCGGYESLGFVNQFGVNTFEYSRDRVCLENIGAYDPNDKQGFPLGFGEQHRIRPGQELDYMIRFQNTGTDTAFNIVVRDTLSPWLDPASVRPGAASHPYTWSLNGEGALKFTFANILLPDSNTNLPGSQGFVRFRVSQRPEVPIGAQIFNEAAIYFDFNAPIITNRTLHTVGMDYLSSISEQQGTGRQDWVTVSPNPVRDAAVFQRKDGQALDGHRITVTNALGKVVWEQKISGEHGRFTRRGLPGGVYFFQVEDAAGRPVDSGKLVFGF